MKVITRFAPSPTGYLHIGGARTALFNYLFAKKNNGKYLVRIEDTDIKRSTPEAVKAIHEGLDWLKIKSSEEIVYQSRQKNKHIDIAYKLLESHFAYKCYLNPDELNTLRVKSRENGVPIKSPWRDKVINDNSKDFVIRLKMPVTGITTINDMVQGDVSINNEILDDMIILRSDKTPTYMLSSVVDDFNMGITHIIRGDDHFNNAFRQIQIIKYLNWDIPVYAHIPLIHGPDGTKLYATHMHVGKMHVKKGDKVKRGQLIADAGEVVVGCGGGMEHLHFQLSKKRGSGQGWGSYKYLGGPKGWLNPHEYWTGGRGKPECFVEGKEYPEGLLTLPVKCRNL